MLRPSFLLALTLLVAGAGARAAPMPEQQVQARRYHEAGKLLFARGEYGAALAEFQRAYEFAPFPQFLFNIARCYEERGDLDEALLVYRKYIAVAPESEWPQISRIIETLERRKARLARGLPPEQTVPPAPLRALAMGPVRSDHVGRRGALIGVAVGGGLVLALGLGIGLGVGLGLQSGVTRLPPPELQRVP